MKPINIEELMIDDKNINLKLSKNIKIFEPICGVFYKKFMDLFLQLTLSRNKKYLNYYNKAYYVYPYYFSNETNIYDKIPEKYKLIKYNPLTIYFYRGIEIYKLFIEKQIKNKSNLVISEICSFPILLEVIKYNNFKINNLNFYKQYDAYIKDDLFDIIKELHNLYNFNSYSLDKSIYSIIDDKDENNKIKKSDIISYGIYNMESNLTNLDNYYNIINLFVGLMVGLKYTKINGTFILNFSAIVNKPTADIYLICKKYFKNSQLYYPEIVNQAKLTGCVGIFTGFLGISEKEYNKLYDILQRLKSKFPNNIDNFYVNDPEIIEMFEVTKEKKDDMMYISEFLDLPIDSPEYDEIIEFNNQRYINQLQFIKKIEKIMDIQDTKLSKNPTIEQITASIMYCKKWNIEYFPYFDSNKEMRDEMGHQILNEMYGNIEPINYKFKIPYQTKILKKNIFKTLKISKSKSKSKSKIKTKTKKKFVSRISNLSDIEFRKKILLDPEMFEINNMISQTGYMIDSRRDFTIKDESRQLSNYFKANVLFRYFKSSGKDVNNDLSFMVRNKINRNVSQAWLKFYEILADNNIINKYKTKYRSFHLCEAPGSFIDCLDYYIKKETNIKDFNWNAQSYKATRGKSYFGDDFGIIKAYPNNWHWGPDGNGDITSCNNIFSYKELCKDVDLITSDCGLPMDQPGYERTLFASMVAITYLLPIDGTMIFKILTPINKPIVWNIIYLWFNSFKEFRFFKPVQNAQSREFYIIGKGFLGIEKFIIDKLLNLVKDQKDTFMSVDFFNDKYPETFVRQVVDISKRLAENWCFTIQKQIYYSDNMDVLDKDKSFLKMANDYIKEKNLDFIEKYNLVKLKKV